MKSKKILISNILFFSSFIFAQETQQQKFKVDAGFEFRIVPFNFKNAEGLYTTNKFFLYNRDKHLSGNSINLSIEYYFLKNTTIGINQSFRYDQLYSDNNLNNPNNYFTTDQHMRIIADTNSVKTIFSIKKHQSSDYRKFRLWIYE